MNTKDWTIPYTRPTVPDGLGSAYPPLLSMLLGIRGIVSLPQARALLEGGEQSLHDPMLMLDMDRAKARVLEAISRGETVAVYGDYDVDGITATCLVTDYLQSKGLHCIPYIPDRNGEGYGLNCAALDTLKSRGVSLVVSVDCGITAVEEARHAKELGIDMVITDHHQCKADALPQVTALIDCKRDGDSYPNRELAGVGVALKLVCACEGESRAVLDKYADLAAIGTVADVMPLTGENRFLVRHGLERIHKSPRPGVAALLAAANSDHKKLNATSIGFTLAPRLNAAGRLGKTDVALRLLMSGDGEEAKSLANELCRLNNDRQNIELQIWNQANASIKDTPPKDPIVLASESWHQGVIGIAASRLAEQYSLPAIIISMNGDTGKGSCRSYGGFNLFDALTACSHLLLGFGGHALAAGLNIRRDMLDRFRQALAEYYHQNRPESVPEVCCDIQINDPALLSEENVEALNLLEPYGNANPKPVMCMCGLRIESCSDVGGGKHLRMRLSLGSDSFECMFFSHSSSQLGIKAGDLIDIAFNPQINEFRGSKSVQLICVALRPHQPKVLCEGILKGEDNINWLAARYCPERPDFVQVWRRLLTEGFSVGKNAEAVIGQCPPAMEPEKFCLCLKALMELGLLKSEDGGIFSARRASIEGKAELEAAPLIMKLRRINRELQGTGAYTHN